MDREMEIICFFTLFQAYFSAAIQAPYYCGINVDSVLPYSFGGTPETQFDRYKSECTEGFQSPINIDKPFIPDPLAFIRFSPSAYVPSGIVTAYNPGHPVHIIERPGGPRTTANFRGVEYLFANVHFHTGTNNLEGSMHTLFGQRYPLEVHIQWYRERYGTLREALKHPGGVIITATIYQIGQRDPQFDNIISVLPKISYANSTFDYQANPYYGTLANFMADVNSGFYSFPGTIEAPPCNQGVLWIVFSTIKTLSARQMAGFRNVLRNPDGELQVKSWRFTQPTRNRPIYQTPPSKDMNLRDDSTNNTIVRFTA